MRLVAIATAPRSNEAGRENSRNPSGYGQFHISLRRLLLDVPRAHLCRRSLVFVKLADIAGGGIVR